MSGNTDVAALTAGVVAVAVTMFVAPGPYDEMGIAIALSLLFVIRGYVLAGTRDPKQKIALACVMGLLTMPILGFCMEHGIRYFGYVPSVTRCDIKGSCLTQIALDPYSQSVIPSYIMFLLWLVVTFLFLRADARRSPTATLLSDFLSRFVDRFASEPPRRDN